MKIEFIFERLDELENRIMTASRMEHDRIEDKIDKVIAAHEERLDELEKESQLNSTFRRVAVFVLAAATAALITGAVAAARSLW